MVEKHVAKGLSCIVAGLLGMGLGSDAGVNFVYQTVDLDLYQAANYIKMFGAATTAAGIIGTFFSALYYGVRNPTNNQ